MSPSDPAVWDAGWWQPARQRVSPNFDARPADQAIDLAVIHSISLPPGVYGGDEIHALFTNQLDPQAHPYFADVAQLKVSSHFLIRRDGQCEQYVSIFDRAWHAGLSQWRGRQRCNDFAIGIELEGLEHTPFEARQYGTLVRVLRAISSICPLAGVAGHEHVSPGRKSDPGSAFDWSTVRSELADLALSWPDDM